MIGDESDPTPYQDRPPAPERTGPAHIVPETWSDERRHILDHTGRCWCGPMIEDIDGVPTITHRPQELTGTVALQPEQGQRPGRGRASTTG